MEIFDCTDQTAYQEGIEAALRIVRAGQVVCLPTDTVYGIGADPFNADAVTALLAAKSRTRQMPPPVLVHDAQQAQTLTAWVSDEALRLMDELWPGALTIILPARADIGWDLGETNGTVALRMPDNPIALDLLDRAGPLAVTSANKTGQPPAVNITQACEQLGDAVGVYLDAGEAGGGVPSTIVKFSPDNPREVQLIRAGAIDPSLIESIANVQVVQ